MKRTTTERVRNLCIEALKEGLAKNGIAVIELDGSFFSGADIAIKGNGNNDVYRIAVIKLRQEESIETNNTLSTKEDII